MAEPTYNPLETQKLFREVENGQWRMLPGAGLIERFYDQMKLMDAELRASERDLQDVERRAPRRRRAEQAIEPVAHPAPAPLVPLSGPAGPVTRLPQPAPGVPSAPRGGGGSPYLSGAREEAAPPIPFSATADPADAPPAPAPAEQPKKRARKIKL